MTRNQTAPDELRTAGQQAARRAARVSNQVTVPMAWNLGLADFVRQTAARAAHNEVLAYAGNIAFRGLFALFPALLALLWLLNVLHAERFVGTLLVLSKTAMPDTASQPLEALLASASQEKVSGAVTVGALLSVILALWSLTGMTRAMMVGLNAIYGVDERRPFWKSTAIALALAVAVAALLLSALFLTVFGSALAQRVAETTGLGPGVRWAWEIVLWPVLVAIVLTACALLYSVGPDVEQRFRWVSPGALLATLLWLLFTVLYSLYVNRFASYEDVYGALAGIIVLMAYFYGAAVILLVGAEMNQVIEASHPTGKQQGERTPTDGEGNHQTAQQRRARRAPVSHRRDRFE